MNYMSGKNKGDFMNKYKIWTHIDSGIEQIITADTEEDAIEIAKNNIINDTDVANFLEQILNNTQLGETDIVSVNEVD